MNDSFDNESFFYNENEVNFTVTSQECGEFPDLETIGVCEAFNISPFSKPGLNSNGTH